MKQPVYLLGIGTAAPRYFMDQREAAEVIKSFTLDSPKTERLVPLIYEKSTVQQRSLVALEHSFTPIKNSEDEGPSTEERMTIYKKEAPILAVEATRSAMRQAEVKSHEINHLVTVSCTGFSAPGFDIALIKELGLSPEISRTHIGFMGCHGTFNGFRVAQALASQEMGGSVLVSSVELCSIHLAYGSDPGQMVANALFADGASSAILSVEKRKEAAWRLAATGSYLFPNSEHLMGWEIGNHGFRMTLSPEVPKMIETYLKHFIVSWLQKLHLTISDIRCWAVHPGGPRILDAVESALGLNAEALSASRQILARYGNMSSATILYIVNELYKANFEPPCLALGFGPGLNLEIALSV